MASSSASVEFDVMADVQANNDLASSQASAASLNTITLLPPKGYTSKTMLFKFDDVYAFKIKGLTSSAQLARVMICWVIGTQFEDCVDHTTDGSGGVYVNKQATLKKSKLGFKYDITKIMFVSAISNIPIMSGGGHIEASAVTINFKAKLPKGWKCRYASGLSCP